MKPWCVVEFPNNYVDFGLGRNLGTGYTFVEVKGHYHEDMYSLNVYFFNNEVDAQIWADRMAKNNINKIYVYCKSMGSVVCQPGPLSKGTFTDQGYVPA